MKEDVIQALITARSYLEQGWVQGPPAKTASGMPTMVMSNDAASWCAFGALYRACMNDKVLDIATFQTAQEVLRDATPGNIHVIIYNDSYGRTKQEVLAVFDKAIKIAKLLP